MTPQRARELLNQYADCSEAVRSELLNEDWKGEKMKTFDHPVIGQEAICPDGLGRVVDYLDQFPFQWIQVETYVNNRGCKWDPNNIKLVPIIFPPIDGILNGGELTIRGNG